MGSPAQEMGVLDPKLNCLDSEMTVHLKGGAWRYRVLALLLFNVREAYLPV